MARCLSSRKESWARYFGTHRLYEREGLCRMLRRNFSHGSVVRSAGAGLHRWRHNQCAGRVVGLDIPVLRMVTSKPLAPRPARWR